MLSRDQLHERARRVRLLSCDVDGVLTDGRVYVDDEGRETKAFHALDGVGIHLLDDAGIMVAWITGSSAPAVAHRARMLGVRYVIQDTGDKLAAWQKLTRELRVDPAHAPASVRALAHYVTSRDGGLGAVRELAEVILTAQGRLEGAPRGRTPTFIPQN